MQPLFRRLLAPVVLAATLALAACGGNTPAQTPTEAPAAQAPTRTPRPTREPTAETQAEPTAAPTAASVPTPADTLGGSGSTTSENGELAAVEIGALETYQHPSGVFQIDVPTNWTLQDNSQADELILVWTDPSRNGGVIVDIFEDDTVYTPEQLTELLTSFLQNSFGSQPDFRTNEPSPQSDDSILIAWSYTAQADNDVDAPLQGNSFVEQRGNKVSILTTLLPSDQFDELREGTDGIINTYRIDPEAALVSAGGGDSGASSGASGGASGVTSPSGGEAGTLPATIVAVGEPVQVGNLTMTVTEVEESEGSELFTPDEGNKFVIVRLRFDNPTATAESVSTLLQMSLVAADGTKYDLDIGAAIVAEQTADGEVPAGGSLEGGAGFQVPADASGLVFVFEPLINGEPVGVQL